MFTAFAGNNNFCVSFLSWTARSHTAQDVRKEHKRKEN